jgi:hypothetical protein
MPGLHIATMPLAWAHSNEAGVSPGGEARWNRAWVLAGKALGLIGARDVL